MEGLTEEIAKEFLKSKGYFVDNLWSVQDVRNKFECTDEQAHEVLYNAFGGEYIGGEINEEIETAGNEMGLTPIEDDED